MQHTVLTRTAVKIKFEGSSVQGCEGFAGRKELKPAKVKFGRLEEKAILREGMTSLSLDTSCTEGASLLTYDCHRTVPAPFLTKTYHLVDDPATDDIVSWGEDETTFVVWRPPEFARDLLPNYFKHNNFSSFVRQLNTYGFRKIVPDHWEFANKFFRRGEKHLLCEIHRRKSSTHASGPFSLSCDAPGSQSTSPTNSGEDQAWSPFPSPLSSPSTILMPQGASTLMSDENERLRHDNRMLLLELSRLRRLYDDLVVILQQQSKVSLQELPSPSLSRDQKLAVSISEQIEAAARRSEIRELNALRFNTNSSSHLRPPTVDSTSASCIGHLLNRPQIQLHRADNSVTPKASTLSFLDGKLREMASNTSAQIIASPLGDDQAKPPQAAPKLFGVSLNGSPVDASSSCHKRPWSCTTTPGFVDDHATIPPSKKIMSHVRRSEESAPATLQRGGGGVGNGAGGGGGPVSTTAAGAGVAIAASSGAPAKCMKVELGLELRISATCAAAERGFM